MGDRRQGSMGDRVVLSARLGFLGVLHEGRGRLCGLDRRCRRFFRGGGAVLAILPVLASVVALALILVFEKRVSSWVRSGPASAAAGVVTGCSTLLLFLSGSGGLGFCLFAAGAVLAGFSSAFLWTAWGDRYACMSQEDVERWAPVCCVLAAVLSLLTTLLPNWAGIAFVALLPILSGVCLGRFGAEFSSRPGEVRAEEPSPIDGDGRLASFRRAFSSMGRAGFGIFAACVFVSVLGALFSSGFESRGDDLIGFLASTLFLLAVGAVVTGGPRRVSLSFMFRWMCPMIVLGFMAVVVFHSPFGAYAANVVSIVSRFLFCLLAQMYFAQYVSTGSATSVRAFGLGWLFVHAGDLVGVLLSLSLGNYMLGGYSSSDVVAAVAAVVVSVTFMYVLDDERSFRFGSWGAFMEAGPKASKVDDGSVERKEGFSDRIEELAGEYRLTSRETEVFDLLARGRSGPYIRDALFISKETVATHRKHIYAKLGVHSQQELIDLVSG